MKFQDETVITMMVEVSDSIFRARGCQKLSEIIALDLSIVFCAAVFFGVLLSPHYNLETADPICNCVCTVFSSVPNDHTAFFRKRINIRLDTNEYFHTPSPSLHTNKNNSRGACAISESLLTVRRHNNDGRIRFHQLPAPVSIKSISTKATKPPRERNKDVRYVQMGRDKLPPDKMDWMFQRTILK